MKIQQQRIRDREYFVLGRLSAVLFEAQRSTAGLSGSRPRYDNASQAGQAGQVQEAMKPFSERQAVLWQSITLDWLQPKNGPLLARSRDGVDLLLPQGLTPLPDIPDPRWVPSHAHSVCPKGPRGCSGCMAPRIKQLLTGCPVVGDRVRDKITSRDGHVFGILHPVTFISFVASGPDGGGHFAKIRGGVNQADGTHAALLIDDDNRGFFVGGTFS
jgi:hypothetical protein